jgi:hypothetical protein
VETTDSGVFTFRLDHGATEMFTDALRDGEDAPGVQEVSRSLSDQRKNSTGRSPNWPKMKNPNAPAGVRRERRGRLIADQTVHRGIGRAPTSRHSITQLARSTSPAGTSWPIIFAALRLITSSKLVGCSTGRSAGLSFPLSPQDPTSAR